MTVPTSWPSPSGAAVTAIPATPSARTTKTVKLKYLGVIGAGAAALGCLLPWASVSAGFLSISINGTTTADGKIGIFLAIAAAVLVLCKNVITDWLAAGLFVAMVILGGVDIARFSKTSGVAIMQPGAGLYLFAIGAVAGLLGALIATRHRRI